MRFQTATRDVLTVNTAVSKQAEEYMESFHALLDEQAELELVYENGAVEPQKLPHELVEILARVVESVAKGGSVTVGTMPKELTTTAAAGMLDVSRPTLMKLINRGEVPAHKVGTHTRLRTEDVLQAKQERLRERREAFEELRDLEDNLGL